MINFTNRFIFVMEKPLLIDYLISGPCFYIRKDVFLYDLEVSSIVFKIVRNFTSVAVLPMRVLNCKARR